MSNMSSNKTQIIMTEFLSFQPFGTPSSLPEYIMKGEGAGIFFLTISLIEILHFSTCTSESDVKCYWDSDLFLQVVLLCL